MKSFLKTLLLLILYIPGLQAQELSELSTDLNGLKALSIFPKDSENSFIFKGKSGSANSGIIDIIQNGQPDPIFQIEAPIALTSHYGIQSSWQSVGRIKKGDVLLARFLMRTIYARQESGEAVVNFYVQQTMPPNDKSIILTVGAGPEWKEFNIPFIAASDMDTGQSSICFSFGAIAQKVQLSNIDVLNFGSNAKLSQLPETRFTYAGRENNASWRTAALKNIENIRTGPLNINVVDKNGKPVEGIHVNARLTKSDFFFGTAVSAGLLCKEAPDSKIYKANLKSLFNTVTIDNGLKWPSWINPTSRECTKSAVNWINKEGFRLRGHNLVWPARKFSPQMYKTKENFGPGFTDSISNHIRQIASFAKGKVVAWDVVNEMVHEKEYFNFMPRSTAAEWFKLAKEIDPNAQLFINEYGMLNSVSSPAMIKTYLNLISELQSFGAPIEGIGVQGHVGRQPRDPSLVISDLDLLSKAGLPIQITEFDINTTDEELQADYTRDFLIACFSHESVTGFTMWGFWEGEHWKPDAAMFRKDWTEKPNAKIWKELVTKEWTTNLSSSTNSKGCIEARGYLGLYEITVTTKENKKLKVMYQLQKNSDPLILKLD